MARDRSDPGSGSEPRYPGSFLLAFREAAEARGWQVPRWLGDAVECAQADGKEQVVGLENLYRRARRAEREEWSALIAEFLNTVGAIELAETRPQDLHAVADRLVLRLGQPIKMLPEEARVWSQPLEGTPLSLNLVIDAASSMSYVTEKLVEESGKPGSEWLEQARQNLQKRTPEDCFQIIHEDSGMLLCTVADAYDSSRALLLDSLLPETAELGCFVAIPGRDELLVLPVSAEGLGTVHLLRLLAEKNFKTAPYAISDAVFWVRGGVWRHFPIQIKGDEVQVSPPPEFIEYLKELGMDLESE